MSDELEKALRKLDRNVDRVKREIEDLSDKIESDVIETFNLRYREDEGLTSEPVELGTDIFSGEFEFPEVSAEDSVTEFEPSTYEKDGAVLEPLTLLITPLTTVLAVRVNHRDEDYRIPLDWVRPRKREDSNVYLVDPKNSEYYYPRSTTLKGEVVANRPRTGLLAFDPLRKPTDTLEVHFSGVELLADGDSDAFSFVHEDPEMSEAIERQLEKPHFKERALEGVEQEKRRVQKELEQHSGCLVVFFLLGAPAALGGALTWMLVA